MSKEEERKDVRQAGRQAGRRERVRHGGIYWSQDRTYSLLALRLDAMLG